MRPHILRPAPVAESGTMRGRGLGGRWDLFLYLLMLTGTLLFQAEANAQSTEQRYDLQIEEMELERALDQLARVTGLQLIYSQEIVQSKLSSGVNGSYTVDEALKMMLQGSRLTGGLTKNRVIVISQDRSGEETMKRKNNATNILGSLFALVLGAEGAVAESAGAASVNDGYIEEIVVTAEKRQTSLQSTPIAITAISAGMIETAQIDDIRDIQQLAPSLTFNDAPAGLQLYMRGVGQDAPTVGNNPAVAVYVDDVYQGHQFANAAAFFDVAQVEVLRGPQGTLYGRNSTGGNINVTSKLPGFEKELNLEVTAGEHGHRRFNASAAGGLNDDSLAIRASYSFSDRDGYRKNLASGKDIDFEELKAASLSLLYVPSEDFEAVLRLDYQDVEGSGNPGSYLATVPGSGLNPLLFGARIVGEESTDVYNDTEGEESGRYWGVSGTMTWQLGEMAFKSITSYRESRRSTFLDSDATDIPFVTIGQTSEAEEFFQEFNLSGVAMNDRLDWIVGANYYRDDVSTDPLVLLPIFALLLPPLPPMDTLDGNSTTIPFIHLNFSEELRSVGVFAQGTYHLSEKLRSTLGVRYTRDEKDVTISNIGNLTAPSAQCRDQKSSESWTTPTFKVGLDYEISDRAMAYGSVSRGFKAGGFNSGSCRDPFDEEKLTAYEIGFKNTFFDRKLVLNTALYYYDYSDLQVRSFTEELAVDIANAAESTIYGLELEFVARPVPGLQLDGGFNLLQSEFDKAMLDQPMVPGVNPEDVSGNQLLRSPETKMNLGVQYTLELQGGSSIQARYDAVYSDDFYVDAFENDFSRIESHTIQNLRITWRNRLNKLFVQAFIENLGDEEYLEWRQSAAAVGGTSGLWAPPRRWGVRVNYSL